MAEYTTHYNLKKPAKNENYNIDVANQNNDIIDEKLYGKVDKKAGKDLSTNDFTNEYKKKLDTLKNYDDAEVIKQITSFNERAGKVEEANTEISKNVEALKTDNETNKTAISELKETTAQNSETITAIQEEQTTQNENIEKNAEGIAQNKKDADEEFTKLKEENNVLKEQIPTGTASGNNIHLEDSSNMDFEWKLRGGSKQATRSGKNVINVRTTVLSTYSSIGEDDWITIERTNTAETGDAFCNFFTKLTKEVKTDTTYTIICEIKSVTTTSGGYLSITNDSTNFAFGATTPSKLLTELKAGDIIINKLKTKSDFTDVTNLLRTFVAVNPQSSVKIVYRLSVIEGDVTADSFEYESYGVSPSPDFPSEIKNVGKSYNLAYPNWAEEFVNIVNDQSKAKIKEENGITFLHYLASVGYQNYDEIHFFPQIEYKENTTYSFEFDLRAEVKNVENICIEYTDGSSERLGMTNGANIWTHFRFSSNPNKTVKYLRSQYSDGRTDINVNTIQIIESPLFKPYNPYNQKQINIEINNDNSFDINKIHRGYYDTSRYLKGLLSNDSCGQLFEIKHDTIIRIKNTSDSSWRAHCVVYDENMNKVKSIWYGDTFKSGIESSKKIDYKNNMKYVSFSIMDITGIYNPEIFRQSAEVGIYDGRIYSLDNLPKYQEHKGMEITFPLEQGQKLYEGSYLAEDGIHQVTKMINIDIDNYTATMAGEGVLSLSNATEHRWNYISIKGLCSHFKNANNENITANGPAVNNLKDNEFNFRAGATKDRIYFKNSSLKILDDWKNFFKNNDVMLAYEVEEEIIPYTQEQQAVIDKILYTYKNVTNISVDDELATLDITYKKDIETMFNNQAKEYNERLSNIENLLNTTETSALLLDNLEDDLEKEV